MWGEGALSAALAAAFVLLTGIGTEVAQAEDRRERDGPPEFQTSHPPPSGALRLLQRIGFRSLDRQDEPYTRVVITREDASGSATTSVPDERPGVGDVRAMLPATPRGPVLSADWPRPSNTLREPRSTMFNRSDVNVAGGPGKQIDNPLRAAGPPAALSRPTLTITDGEPAKSHLEDQPQSREPERQVAAAADVDGAIERIPAFRMSPSSRRTAHLRTNKANVADESWTAGSRAPAVTRDDTRASHDDMPLDLAASRTPAEAERKATPAFAVNRHTVRQQEDTTPNAEVEEARVKLSDSVPRVTNPLRSRQRGDTHRRPQFEGPQSSPTTYHPDQPLVTPLVPAGYRNSGWPSPADQVTKRAIVNKPGISGKDAPLQPRSTIVSKVAAIPSLPERDVQKIAPARSVTSSTVGQPSVRRGASLSQATVPENEERDPRRLPKADLRDRLPAPESVAPLNTLRALRVTTSTSKRAQSTAPNLLPKDETTVEAKPLPASSPSLRLAVRESRMIRSPENVVRVSSANAEVCQVVQLNARDVAVVGKSRGTTEIEFWYDKRGVSRVSHIVAVGPDQAFETPEDDRYQEVHKLISYLFPDSQVELICEEDRLVVRGRTGTRRQAIQILSIIRRSQLVPVVDELAVTDG